MLGPMAKPNPARERHDQIAKEIDANLKRAFDQLAGEPVPKRFTDLLKQLQDKEAAAEQAQPEETRSDD